MRSRSGNKAKAPRKARGRPGTIGATDFKARCLEILDGVAADGIELVITKRGRPVARLSPYVSTELPLEGLLEGRITILGDIVSFNVADEWEASK